MKQALSVLGLLLAGAVIGVIAVGSAAPKAGPKIVPTCEENAVLLVRAQRTGQDWFLCFHAQYGVIRAALDPAALP